MEPIEPIAVSDVRVHLRREPFDFHAVARNSKVHGVSGIIIRDVRCVSPSTSEAAVPKAT